MGSNTQLIIKGTVTDQSPGTTALGIPEAGTPAISDTYMSNWMAYLFQQQPEPMNTTGVPVTLTYIDPNNNTYTIGQTTSDITGQFTYSFTPTISGTYTIIATFGGSNSYYSSTAQTTMQFAQPAAATPTSTSATTTLATTSDIMMYMTVGVIAIIIAIALVGLLLLRKKP
jgi:outer membrane protein assembly factor BamE (lipoprotein component of BamABCDE complex)